MELYKNIVHNNLSYSYVCIYIVTNYIYSYKNTAHKRNVFLFNMFLNVLYGFKINFTDDKYIMDNLYFCIEFKLLGIV